MTSEKCVMTSEKCVGTCLLVRNQIRGFCFPIHTISKTQLDLDCYLLYDLSKHNKGIGMCHCLIKELIDGLRCVLCRFGFLFCVFFSDVIMVQSIDRV